MKTKRVRIVLTLSLVLSILIPATSASAEDYHQNAWTRLNWQALAMGPTGNLEQEFTPLRLDWPREGHTGWTFYHHIDFCFQKSQSYGSGGTCGYFGVGLYSNSKDEYFGNLDLALYDGSDFRINNVENQQNCEKRDPSQNVQNTNYIVCWAGVKLQIGTKYIVRLVGDPKMGENWWRAELVNTKTGQTNSVGSIKGIAADSNKEMQFVASNVGYTGPTTKCSEVPVSDYLLGIMKTNGRAQSYSGINSGSCTTSAVSQSSIASNGYFLRTGGINPVYRNYSTSAGSSEGSSQPSPSASSGLTEKAKVGAPSFSYVDFKANTMNIAVDLLSNSTTMPDKVYLVAPKLGYSTSNPIAGKISAGKATWSINFNDNLRGAFIALEITSEKDGVKSNPLTGSYALPGVKCPPISDSSPYLSQPKVLGFQFTGTIQNFVRVDSLTQKPVDKATDLIGCYVEPKYINTVSPDWQIGSIGRDVNGFYWINGAGVTWRLTVVENGTKLETDKANPYYDQGRYFALNLGKDLKATAVPPAPTSFASEIVGSNLMLSVLINTKESALATNVFLYSSALGIPKSKAIRGIVIGDKAQVELPIKSTMMGKSLPLSIYLSNKKGESKPLNTTVKVPKKASTTPVPKAVPAPKPPKIVICTRANQTRAFEGDQCPPGYEKR